MQRMISVLALAGFLSGCSAGLYNPSAVPDAQAGLDRNMDGCALKTRNGDFTTATEMVDCYVRADRAYALTIKLRRTELFTAYAARMNELGREVDAGRISRAEGSTRFDNVRNNYYASLSNTYRADAPDNQFFVKMLAALGQGAARNEAATPGK